MPSFPQLFAGSAALYPATRGNVRRCGKLEYSNATEQRWVEAAGTARWALQLDGITASDANTIQNFFDTVKGGFDSFDLTLGGATYNYLRLEEDTLTITQDATRSYRITARLMQTRKN